jgi:hypothetical protein
MAGSPSRTLVLTLTAVTDKFSKGLGDADKQLGGFSTKLGSFAKAGALAFAAIGAAAGAMAIKVGKEAISAASDLSEEISKASVIFGNSAGAIDEWASSAATAFGQSRRQATAAASNFAIFGESAGLADDDLVDFSTGLTELASDLASFSNTSPEDAVQALGAALRGESEPIRRYGVLLNDQTLRQRALEMGIVDTTKNALTPQQRVLAAQAEIFAQTATAQGDFARTSDGLANSQRILSANLEDVKATLGEALLPVAEQFSGWLVSVLPDVIAFAKEMGEKFGPYIQRAGDWIRDTLLPAARDVWPHIRDFALWVKDVVTGIRDFMRDEVAPRMKRLMEDMEEPVTNAWTAIKEMSTAIRDMTSAFQAANPEGSKLLDFLFWMEKVKWNFIIDRIEKVAKAVEVLAKAIEYVINLGNPGAFLGGAGGDFNLPDNFVPGTSVPSTRSSSARPQAPVTININGALDSESAAREIRRILSDSNRRTGFQPIAA